MPPARLVWDTATKIASSCSSMHRQVRRNRQYWCGHLEGVRMLLFFRVVKRCRSRTHFSTWRYNGTGNGRIDMSIWRRPHSSHPFWSISRRWLSHAARHCMRRYPWRLSIEFFNSIAASPSLPMPKTGAIAIILRFCHHSWLPSFNCEWPLRPVPLLLPCRKGHADATECLSKRFCAGHMQDLGFPLRNRWDLGPVDAQPAISVA